MTDDQFESRPVDRPLLFVFFYGEDYFLDCRTAVAGMYLNINEIKPSLTLINIEFVFIIYLFASASAQTKSNIALIVD